MYEEEDERSRATPDETFSRAMYAVRDAGWFLAAFLALWPEPLCESLPDGRGNGAEAGLSTFPMDSNFVYVGMAFLVFNLAWFLFSERMRVTPKRFSEWRLMLQFMMIPLGLSAGMAWRTAVGVTMWEGCCPKGHPAVVGMHWRPEIRAVTGLDSLFGIDLTIPRAKTYRVSRAVPECDAGKPRAHTLGHLYAADAAARICRDRSGDILAV